MKKIILAAFVFISLTVSGCVITSEMTTTNRVVYHPNPTFKDLDNYGTWMNIPDYGTVWKPYDEVNWQPYADGQWVWTDQGWMWDSNEPYGWVVYHYGYWQYTDFDGWFWIPGYDWAPARVNWYRSNGYVGWAPVPPPAMGRAVIYDNNYANRVWVVVPEQNFAGQDAVKYRNRSYVPDAQTLRSYDGRRAPEIRDIERVSNRTINVVQPTREQVTAGNRQLTRVRVGNSTPASPATIRNQPSPVRVPANNSPVVNPQRPAANPPVTIDRKPANNPVQNQPVEKNNPVQQIDRTKNNNGTNNANQNKSGQNNTGRRKGKIKKQPAPANQQPAAAPANNQPAAQPAATPARGDNSNNDKKDDKRERPDQGR